MPFLRVIRDKRGYETTYLMHWYREGNRQRSRILYLFRTPGGVRIGRDPFDPEVLHRIEATYPSINFDWAVVRENQQVVDTGIDTRRRRPRREEEAPAEPDTVPPEPAPPSEPAVVEASADPVALPQSRPPLPSSIDGETVAERVAFLAHWYPLVCERITVRVADPARRDRLMELAIRLDGSGWTDPDAVTKGLELAADALARLSHLLARRRRRPRRRGEPGGGTPSVGSDKEAGAPDPDDPADAS